LVVGLTLVVRLPRLGHGKRWQWYGWIALVIGMVLYAVLVEAPTRSRIGFPFLYFAGADNP
ncbi:MAG: hypothetical protein JWQ44_1433, partial [Chthoniobacter sp.]|nr:hypothetical protein [Chthoniobacter sp.]